MSSYEVRLSFSPLIAKLEDEGREIRIVRRREVEHQQFADYGAAKEYTLLELDSEGVEYCSIDNGKRVERWGIVAGVKRILN